MGSLVACKNEEDLIKNEGARVVTTSFINFSDAQGQLTPKSVVGWFCCFTSQVNSYGHCGTVSSPNHTFSWAGLNKRLTSNLCTYFRL